MPAGPQLPPWNGSFSFTDAPSQEPYPDCPYIGASGNMPGPQHEHMFSKHSIPPQEQFMPGTAQPGMPEQRGFFAHAHMQTMQQGPRQPAYVQGAYPPQQHAPQQHAPIQHEVAPGLQQQYMRPCPVRQPGEQFPLHQDMGMQSWAGSAGMPYERSPKVTWPGFSQRRLCDCCQL